MITIRMQLLPGAGYLGLGAVLLQGKDTCQGRWLQQGLMQELCQKSAHSIEAHCKHVSQKKNMAEGLFLMQ